jgi:hypothetical protein
MDMNLEAMDLESIWAKRPATIEEIRWRVANALDRHPLCRGVEFDIISMPRTRRSNWTVSLKAVRSDALFEANEIVADIQEAYDLAVAA